MATSTLPAGTTLSAEQQHLRINCLSDVLFDLHMSLRLARTVLYSSDLEDANIIAAELLSRLIYVAGFGLSLSGDEGGSLPVSLEAEECLLTPVAYAKLEALRAATPATPS